MNIRALLLVSMAVPMLAATPVRANDHAAETPLADTRQIIDWGTAWKRHFEAGDTEKLRDMYEPDAVLMANGAPPKIGVDDILEFLGRNKVAGNKVTIDFANEEISVEGRIWLSDGKILDDYSTSRLSADRGHVAVLFWSIERARTAAGGCGGTWTIKAPDVRAEDRPEPLADFDQLEQFLPPDPVCVADRRPIIRGLAACQPVR